MRSFTVIANFKAELDGKGARTWIEAFREEVRRVNLAGKTIVLCPPYIYLEQFKSRLDDSLPVYLGAQDVSGHDTGPYTGEVTAAMLSGLADFVIIGHSERRMNAGEAEPLIQKKIYQANAHDLKVILCTEKSEEYRGDIHCLAYEPLSAIGTGRPASPVESYEHMETLKKVMPAENYLYGGSVDKDNALEFTAAGFDGLLIGKRSLDPGHFLKIVEAL